MGYELFGRIHAAMVGALRAERGQGTVEYVGVVLLLAAVLAAIVTAAKSNDSGTKGLAHSVIQKIQGAINDVGKGKPN